MTTPQPDNTTPPASGQPDGHLGELATAVAIGLLLRHAAQALHLEHGAGRRAVTPIRTAAVELSRWAARQWVTTAGGLDKPLDPIQWSRLQSDLVQRLHTVKPDPAPTLPLDVAKAYRLGTGQAYAALALPVPHRVPAPTLPLPDIGRVIDRRYATTERLLATQPIQSWDQLTLALAPTHAAASDVDRAARTAINTAVNLAAHDVAVQAGADLLWFAEKDACVTCAALSGTVVGHDEDFDADATFGDKPTPWHRGSGEPLRPPRHPRCFPAGVVASGPAVEAATARWYSGELVNIRVASGEVLPVTPNHPILTTQGWVAAGLLRQGMQVVRDRGLQGIFGDHPNDYQSPTRIEDVAAALRVAGSVTTERMPVAPEDFHGDGIESYVDVVRPDRGLGNGIEIGQPLDQSSFILADHVSGGGTPPRGRDQLVSRHRPAPDGGMGRLGESGAFLGAGGSHAGEHGSAAIAGDDTGSGQERGHRGSADALGIGERFDAYAVAIGLDKLGWFDGMPAEIDIAPLGRVSLRLLASLLDGEPCEVSVDSARLGTHGDSSPDQLPAGVVLVGAELVGQCLAALPGLVALDEVVEVSRRPFAGHVYNLETSDGWYTANGLIVHNCRCRCEPWLGHNGPPGSLTLPDALKREAARSVLRGWSLPSESEQVRIRAADRLLKRGSSLPKSVRAYARKSVNAGRFPTRTLPTGKETA